MHRMAVLAIHVTPARCTAQWNIDRWTDASTVVMGAGSIRLNKRRLLGGTAHWDTKLKTRKKRFNSVNI